ncbi:hypothetical protein VTH06DRAFT_3638 [Thermothelomyces fergusii]
MPIAPHAPVPAPYPVRVHHYLPSSSSSSSSSSEPRAVQTYEHIVSCPPSPSSSSPPPPTTTPHQAPRKNALVFVGGLGDGPHTIPYVRRLAEHLAGAYAVFEARLASAFSGFGHASLAQDARELADLVRYLRRGLGAARVVLMGHSTGCQDCLEYVVRGPGAGGGEEEDDDDNETRVDALVLQGPVSDREAVGLSEDPAEVRRSLDVAEEMVRQGRGADVVQREAMPRGWRAIPVTAYRWASLVGVGGDDDYFSSDLPDSKLEHIWGSLKQPVLIVPSEKDEWVSPEADVAGLVDKWKSFCRPGTASDLGGLIPGANHRVDNEAGQQWLVDRVARFLARLEESP